MRQLSIFPAVIAIALGAIGAQQPPPAAPTPPRGARLEELTWDAAEQRLKPDTVVVLPLGAGAQQHGPHMKLGAGASLTQYVTRQIVDGSDVVAAPLIPYHYFPAFVEYQGSTTLAAATARDLVADVARSLARFGPRRFYVLNTGTGNAPALAESAKSLGGEGILLRYIDLRSRLDATIRRLQRQVIGGHADEIETSMMLAADASLVDMSRAVREYGNPSTPLRLARVAGGGVTHSSTGAWGDATLATREKGRELLESFVAAALADIEDLRRAIPGAGSPAAPAPEPAERRNLGPRPDGRPLTPGQCQPGDDRTIRAIGTRYSTFWQLHDALNLAGLWKEDGDMMHPDGFIEGSAAVIRDNRAQLLARREYKDSRHGLTLGQIRCIDPDIAIADGKWDLRGVTDSKGQPVPMVEGLCTLVVKRTGGRWLIEAYRYSMNQPRPTGPVVSSKPGVPTTSR
jgi:creatinine amidohydrolase